MCIEFVYVWYHDLITLEYFKQIKYCYIDFSKHVEMLYKCFD